MISSDIILEITKHVPALIVLAYLVYIHQRSERETTTAFIQQLEDSEVRREARVKDISDACHAVQRDSIKAMAEVSRRLGENTQAFHSLQTVLTNLTQMNKRD